MAQELKLVFSVDDQGSIKIENIKKTIEGTTQSISSMGKALQLIQWDAVTNLIQKAASSIERVFQAMQTGAKNLQVEQTFYALANAAGVSGAAMLASMARASQGTISSLSLMQGAVEGLRGHLNPDMINKLTEASLTFSAAAGTTATEAFGALMNVIETGRMRQLAGLGENFRAINVAMENYALALGKNSVQELSATQRATALFQVLGQLAKGLEGANIKLSEQFIAIQQAQAVWSNFMDFMYKVALAGFSGLTALWYQWVAIVKGALAAVLGALVVFAGALSNIPGLGFLQKNAEAGLADVQRLMAESDAAQKRSLELNKIGPALVSKPTDIPGRGILPPALAGKSQAEAQSVIAKDWISEMKKLLDSDIANLQAWAEAQKALTEKALTELQVLKAGYLISEKDFILQRGNIEKQGLEKLIQNIEDEKTTTLDSYAAMLKLQQDAMATDKANKALTTAKEAEYTSQIATLVDERNKKIADLTRQGTKFQEDLQKKSADTTIALIPSNRTIGGGILAGLTKFQDQYKSFGDQVFQTTTNICNDIENTFGSMWNGIFDNSTTFAQKMQKLFQNLAQSIINELWKSLVVSPLMKSLGLGGSGSAGGGGWGNILKGISWIGGLFSSSPAGAGGAAAPSWFEPVASDVFQYAQGTNYVPDNQLAFIHKGEAVVPAEYNKGSGEDRPTIVNNYFGVTDAEGYRRMALQNKDLHQGMALSAFADAKRTNSALTRRSQ